MGISKPEAPHKSCFNLSSIIFIKSQMPLVQPYLQNILMILGPRSSVPSFPINSLFIGPSNLSLAPCFPDRCLFLLCYAMTKKKKKPGPRRSSESQSRLKELNANGRLTAANIPQHTTRGQRGAGGGAWPGIGVILLLLNYIEDKPHIVLRQEEKTIGTVAESNANQSKKKMPNWRLGPSALNFSNLSLSCLHFHSSLSVAHPPLNDYQINRLLVWKLGQCSSHTGYLAPAALGKDCVPGVGPRLCRANLL